MSILLLLLSFHSRLHELPNFRSLQPMLFGMSTLVSDVLKQVLASGKLSLQSCKFLLQLVLLVMAASPGLPFFSMAMRRDVAQRISLSSMQGQTVGCKKLVLSLQLFKMLLLPHVCLVEACQMFLKKEWHLTFGRNCPLLLLVLFVELVELFGTTLFHFPALRHQRVGRETLGLTADYGCQPRDLLLVVGIENSAIRAVTLYLSEDTSDMVCDGSLDKEILPAIGTLQVICQDVLQTSMQLRVAGFAPQQPSAPRRKTSRSQGCGALSRLRQGLLPGLPGEAPPLQAPPQLVGPPHWEEPLMAKSALSLQQAASTSLKNSSTDCFNSGHSRCVRAATSFSMDAKSSRVALARSDSLHNKSLECECARTEHSKKTTGPGHESLSALSTL